MKTRVARSMRILFGLLGVSAIITEIVTLLAWGEFSPANFFSFFTILSNIFAACMLITYGIFHKQYDTSTTWQAIRGAVTLYMLMTGVIFALLLANLPNARLTAVPWDNIVLHYLMPIIVLLDWAIFPPKVFLKRSVLLAWIAFPIAYVGYSLLRGPIVNWYPYPFLNPEVSSYTQVALIVGILSVGVIVAGFVLLWYARHAGNPVVYKHSAGGVVIHDGRALLIHWALPRDSYDFPKGSIDTGETSDAACIREVKEETGYDTEIIRYIGQTRYEYDWKDGSHHKKRVDYYLLQLIGDPAVSVPKRERHETFENIWVPLEEAEARITRPIDKEILQKAVKSIR